MSGVWSVSIFGNVTVEADSEEEARDKAFEAVLFQQIHMYEWEFDASPSDEETASVNAAISDEDRHIIQLEAWIRQGQDLGVCTEKVCVIHEGLPCTAEEDELFNAGEDPCQFAVRTISAINLKAEIDANRKER